MKIIFLEEYYDLFPDAGAICLKEIVKNIDECIDYHIFCNGYTEYEDRQTLSREIHHVSVRYQKEFNQSNCIGKIGIVFNRLLALPSWPIRFPQKVNDYIKEISKLVDSFADDEEINIVAVYLSAEMLEVGYQMACKYDNVNLIVYSLDKPCCDLPRHFSHIFNLKQREIKWLDKIYQKSSCILQMETNKMVVNSIGFSKYNDRIRYVGFPLISELYFPQENRRKNTILYAGRFHKKIREPYYLIKYICELSRRLDCQIELYTEDEYSSYIDKMIAECGNVSRNNYISSEEMNSLICSVGYLLNLGNVGTQEVPSKVFKYISSGNSIIHLYTEEDDSCLPFLRGYSNVLLLNCNDSIEENVVKTIDFFKTNSEPVQFSMIKQRFEKYTPEYTCEIIKNVMKNTPFCVNEKEQGY